MYYKDLPPITNFKDHLLSFGGVWTWKDHHVPDDNDWIVAGMKRGTLICVTDRSYDRKKAPTICGDG